MSALAFFAICCGIGAVVLLMAMLVSASRADDQLEQYALEHARDDGPWLRDADLLDFPVIHKAATTPERDRRTTPAA